MAVEFYDIGDKNLRSVLFKLNDTDFETLIWVLSEFKKQTGLIIDQYGTTRIAYNHIILLKKLIAAGIKQKPQHAYKLSLINQKLDTVVSDMIAVGD